MYTVYTASATYKIDTDNRSMAILSFKNSSNEFAIDVVNSDFGRFSSITISDLRSALSIQQKKLPTLSGFSAQDCSNLIHILKLEIKNRELVLSKFNS